MGRGDLKVGTVKVVVATIEGDPPPLQRVAGTGSVTGHRGAAQRSRRMRVLYWQARFHREQASMVEVVGRSRFRVVLTLVATPLVLVACSKDTTASNPPQATAPVTVPASKLPSPTGPPNTGAAAAPTNAKSACEHLTAAIDQLSSDDRSVNQAVSSVQAGIDSAIAASTNDPSYTKLRADGVAFLVDVVRLQVQRQVSGQPADASKYPASYRETVNEIKADCR